LPNILEEADKTDDQHDHIVWFFYGYKWYTQYSDVKAIMVWLSNLDDNVYGFIRIGEEMDDIEFLGDPNDFDLYVSRTIVHG
jgi:hypothetical protein